MFNCFIACGTKKKAPMCNECALWEIWIWVKKSLRHSVPWEQVKKANFYVNERTNERTEWWREGRNEWTKVEMNERRTKLHSLIQTGEVQIGEVQTGEVRLESSSSPFSKFYGSSLFCADHRKYVVLLSRTRHIFLKIQFQKCNYSLTQVR